MNAYTELKQRQSEESNKLPLYFAFSDKQFQEVLDKLGMTVEQKDQFYALGKTGGFYLKVDSAKIHEMFDRHEKEREEAIASDTKGDGYIFDMFLYELNNHEYGYTGDPTDTLNALGLTPDLILANKALHHGFSKAVQHIKAEADKRGC